MAEKNLTQSGGVEAIEYGGRSYLLKGMVPALRPTRYQIKSVIGQRYNKVVVEAGLGIDPLGVRWVGCLCDCGARVALRWQKLVNGETKSCGCFRRNPLDLKLPTDATNAVRRMFDRYRLGARIRGLEWALSIEEFFHLVTAPCTYCGVPPSRERKGATVRNKSFVANGIDRVDNNVGYVTKNATPCCWECNKAKGKRAPEEFNAWISRIGAFHAAGAKRSGMSLSDRGPE